jgi:hypothetical protein
MPWPEETLWDQVVRLIVQGGSGRAIGEARSSGHAPQGLLRAAQSMPAKPRLLLVKPSVDRETAIGELSGRTLDRSDFV